MGKTIYLHIGLPKTASSLIQAVFHRSPEVLRQFSVRYLSAGTDVFDDFGHHALVMAALGEAGARIDPGKSPELIAATWAKALDEIAQCTEDKIFISSELFSLDMANPADITRLRDSLAGYEVRIVLVLRDVVDFVNSVYAQRIRDGYDGEIETFVGHIWPSLNWANLAGRWSSVFGAANMITLSFKDLDRSALVDDFFRKVFDVSYQAPLFETPHTNASLPHSAIALLKELNGAGIPQDDMNRFRHELHQFIGRHRPDLKRADFLNTDAKAMLRLHCTWPQTLG